MALAAIPTTFLLSKEEISLGAFTTDLAAVHEDNFAPKVNGVARSIEKEFKFMNQKGFKTQTKFSAALSSSISAKLFGKSAWSCSIAADHAKWYLLENVTTWFKRAMESEEMKVWIQDQAGSNRSIYMIIGIQTLINPRIELDFTGTKQNDVALRLPLELPPNFEIIRPAIEGGGGRETTNTLEISASGEQIFALRYRKVTFKWLRRLSSNPTQLSPSCMWTCLDTPWRGAGDQNDDLLDSSDEDMSDDERDNVIEVTVETESTLPDENWVEENTENGHYCISTII